METLEYRCPNCNAYLVFDPKSGKMKCDYCLSDFTVDEVKENNDTRGKVHNEGHVHTHSEEQTNGDYFCYSCPSCGGEIIGDSTTAAIECPFCENPTVITQRLSGEFKPDYVIPFKITKKEAVSALEKLYGGKKLLPNAFTRDNRVKKVTGMYVPYWICDCEASGTVSYDATRVHTFSSGKYITTRTDFFKVVRRGTVAFDNIPQDGTTKLEGIHTESIEPYDYSEMIPFSNEYLSGYFADIYDVNSEDVLGRVAERAKASVKESFKETVIGYATVSESESNIDITKGDIHYALLPVWMLNTNWNGKTYTFAMNGQTGKVVGDLPVDKKKFWKRTAMFFGIFAAVAAVVAFFI